MATGGIGEVRSHRRGAAAGSAGGRSITTAGGGEAAPVSPPWLPNRGRFHTLGPTFLTRPTHPGGGRPSLAFSPIGREAVHLKGLTHWSAGFVSLVANAIATIAADSVWVVLVLTASLL